MEQIETFVEEIVAKKAKATNKDTMGDLVDLLIEKVKNMAAGIYDPEAVVVLKATHADEIAAIVKKAADEHKAFEAKIAELQEYFDAHLQEIAGYKSTIGELDTEINSLHEQLTQQDQETEDLRTQLNDALEIVADATSGFNASAAIAASPLEVEVDGQKIKVNHGVDFEGKQYTAQDLIEDTEVLRKLLAIGSGSITLIEE